MECARQESMSTHHTGAKAWLVGILQSTYIPLGHLLWKSNTSRVADVYAPLYMPRGHHVREARILSLVLALNTLSLCWLIS